MPFKIVWSLADSILLILSWSQINPSLLKKKKNCEDFLVFCSVQLTHSVMSDSATQWTAAPQASLSIISFRSLLKPMSNRVGDAIQPSHPLLSPSPPAFNLFQHQGLSKIWTQKLIWDCFFLAWAGSQNAKKQCCWEKDASKGYMHCSRHCSAAYNS